MRSQGSHADWYHCIALDAANNYFNRLNPDTRIGKWVLQNCSIYAKNRKFMGSLQINSFSCYTAAGFSVGK